MLGDWSGMDKDKAKNYILNCQVCLIFLPLSFFYVFKKKLYCATFSVQSYDGGFGLIPGSESHGQLKNNSSIIFNVFFVHVH